MSNNQRPSFENFKEKALQNSEVKTEYEELKPIFELKKQMIKARLEANLTQADVALLLHTKTSNISRLESPNTKHVPNLATLIDYAKAIGYELQISLTSQTRIA
jgi:DNA-binding XRE family transcriptional regulator